MTMAALFTLLTGHQIRQVHRLSSIVLRESSGEDGVKENSLAGMFPKLNLQAPAYELTSDARMTKLLELYKNIKSTSYAREDYEDDSKTGLKSPFAEQQDAPNLTVDDYFD